MASVTHEGKGHVTGTDLSTPRVQEPPRHEASDGGAETTALTTSNDVSSRTTKASLRPQVSRWTDTLRPRGHDLLGLHIA